MPIKFCGENLKY